MSSESLPRRRNRFRPLARLRAMTPAERRLLAEALLVHTRISVAARLRPMRELAARASAPDRPASPVRAPDVALIVRMVEASSRRSPWRSVCLHRALTLQTLLRRRGIPSILHYGISPVARGFGAHMWVTLGDRILTGGETRAGHACVAHFPPGEAEGACPG